MSTSATEALRHEHRLILRVVAAFEQIMAVPPPDGPDLDDVDDCITFFRLYTDACHHGKEEDLLFAALEDHGVPGGDGPIAAMREEHRAGRVIVAGMAAASQRHRAGAAGALDELLATAAAYTDFIRSHIAREDDGLFDVADGIIDGPACTALCAAYDTVCARRFEGRSLADLESLAERLIDRHPAT
jgi:hemerythrin-like domain-containing protein